MKNVSVKAKSGQLMVTDLKQQLVFCHYIAMVFLVIPGGVFLVHGLVTNLGKLT